MGLVKEVIEKKGAFVATAGKDSTVLEAARQMNEHRIGALVVLDNGRVIGICTERDIMTKVVAAQRDPQKTRVAEVMTFPVACCRLDTTTDECRAVMTNRRIRHLPVVEDEKLLGIVTIGDLTARQVKEHKDTIHFLNEYICGPTVEKTLGT